MTVGPNAPGSPSPTDPAGRVEPGTFLDHRSDPSAQAGSVHPNLQGLPKGIRQEREQNVSLDAMFQLMPNRTDLQIALARAKDGFHIGQLHIGLLKHLERLPGQIGPQQNNACQYDAVKARECPLNLVRVMVDKILHNCQYLPKLKTSLIYRAVYS